MEGMEATELPSNLTWTRFKAPKIGLTGFTFLAGET